MLEVFEHDEYDEAVVLSALEIARVILSGHDEGTLLWSKEYVLEELDITNEEADILLEKIEDRLK